ncbi:MAG TPA: hypothetical protein ENN66_05880 [Proteobacteria bacterium]|nr:hypothetical protein [Pseudomonadota bacterium]
MRKIPAFPAGEGFFVLFLSRVGDFLFGFVMKIQVFVNFRNGIKGEKARDGKIFFLQGDDRLAQVCVQVVVNLEQLVDPDGRSLVKVLTDVISNQVAKDGDGVYRHQDFTAQRDGGSIRWRAFLLHEQSPKDTV